MEILNFFKGEKSSGTNEYPRLSKKETHRTTRACYKIPRTVSSKTFPKSIIIVRKFRKYFEILLSSLIYQYTFYLTRFVPTSAPLRRALYIIRCGEIIWTREDYFNFTCLASCTLVLVSFLTMNHYHLMSLAASR